MLTVLSVVVLVVVVMFVRGRSGPAGVVRAQAREVAARAAVPVASPGSAREVVARVPVGEVRAAARVAGGAGVSAALMAAAMTPEFAAGVAVGADERDFAGNWSVAEALASPGDAWSGLVLAEAFSPVAALVVAAEEALSGSWVDDV